MHLVEVRVLQELVVPVQCHQRLLCLHGKEYGVLQRREGQCELSRVGLLAHVAAVVLTEIVAEPGPEIYAPPQRLRGCPIGHHGLAEDDGHGGRQAGRLPVARGSHGARQQGGELALRQGVRRNLREPLAAAVEVEVVNAEA